MAIGSNIADWHWLMSVEWYLMPFAPICSLYPLTLAVWFTIFYKRKKVPNWLTTFIFIAITSYGVMAYVYYPAYMNEFGVHWRLIGNMAWVTIYALQSLIIMSELKPIPLLQFAPIIAYFLFKDYADRYLGSFIDVLRPDFPEYLKDFLGATILILHTISTSLAVFIAQKNASKEKLKLRPQEQSATNKVE